MARVKAGLKVNPPSDSHKGIMSAEDQIKHFEGWHYLVESNRFLGPKFEGLERPNLTPESFDGLMGGYLFFIGIDATSSAEHSRSASHAFTHTRVVDGLSKVITPDDIRKVFLEFESA